MSELQPFVHLHVHSYFSVLDGQARVDKLVDMARADGQRGLALTDHGAMFGIKEFTNYTNKINAPINKEIKDLRTQMEQCTDDEERKALEESLLDKEKQIFKPIIGCECYCARNGRHSKDKPGDKSGYHLIVLAKNLTGYHNLIKMVSRSYTEGFYYRPRIDKELLEEYHEGLIVSSACLGGEIPRLIDSGKVEEAKESVRWFKSIFGDDYYLELQRHRTDKPRANQETYPKQQKVNKVLLEIGQELGVKCIATNDVHFAAEEDGEAHERLICLSLGRKFSDPDRLRMAYTKQEWLKSTAEMNEIFGDIPEVLANTQEILDKVEIYSIDQKPLMPDFPIPEGFADADDYLRHLSYEGAKRRYGEELTEEITERLDFELGTIKNMGFPGYFLIVQDFIAAARGLGVSVGPGRGSAAGSIVAYALKITDLDPLRYGLLFERFLNPDRISLPDIDVDFDDDGRQEILQWVTDHYGEDHVAHIVTYGTMASKSAIKDLGRVLELSIPETNEIAKMIPDRIEGVKKITIKACLENVPDLRDVYYGQDKLKRDVLDYAMQLEGTVRNTGVHACGIIIGKVPISDIVPTWVTKDSITDESILVTQYEGSVIEDTGLIKMDFLGLKTLSIIKEAVRNIKKRHGIDLDIDAIPIDDEKTYRLFSQGNTGAIFQFESPGMQKSLKQLRPTVFEDLIAMVALYRPGPMDNIPSFIARKHGLEPIEYDLPEMKEYLEETYGITVYQEQVMLLSRKLSNFTRGESDNLRKAMGKKKIDQMMKLKDKYLKGGQENGHPLDILERIWLQWEKFASYAFNKSHAACYAWLSYQTGYLKAHYPSEYMAGVMSRNVNNITEITKSIEECHSLGLQVLCPDINESDYAFSVNERGDIRFGLGAIKGFSRAAANAIVREREENGPYTDVYDFFKRSAPSVTTRKVCENLVYSGAFDSLGDFSREDYLTPYPGRNDGFLDQLIRYAQSSQNDLAGSRTSLFGDTTFMDMAKPSLDIRAPRWSDIERLKEEKERLGLYLTATPLDKYSLILQYKCNLHCDELRDGLDRLSGQDFTLAGLVTGYRQSYTKKGAPCSFIKIQDLNGEGEIALFGENHVKYSSYGKEGLFILLKGKIEPSRYDPQRNFMTIHSISLLDEVYENMLSSLTLNLHMDHLDDNMVDQLIELFSQSADGPIDLTFKVYDPKHNLSLNLSLEQRHIAVSPSLIQQIDDMSINYELN